MSNAAANSDNLKLNEEVQSLKKLGEHYEKQLKLISFELCDVPDDVSALLDKCVDMKCATQLHDLKLNYLQEYYYTKKRESIDSQLIVSQQSAALQQLQREIDESTRQIAELESFTGRVNKRVFSDSALLRSTLAMETKTQGLLDRQKALKIPEGFNIEALMDKVDVLERRK